MVRTKHNGQDKEVTTSELALALNGMLDRLSFARRLGWSYGDDRKIYEALGYPKDDTPLTFTYYWNKYDRQDIASAIIDKPVDMTWNGSLIIVEKDEVEDESNLTKAWLQLNKDIKVKQRLNKVDKLAGIGHYAILLFGLNDIKKKEHWILPAGGRNNKLIFLKQINERDAVIEKWEVKSGNPRFGQPRLYRITIRTADEKGESKDILVHHSRLLHIKEGSLISEVYGRPRLKPILNRLIDLEKLLGGDAEMFWRGARPGYTATPQKDYEMGDKERTQLETELDKYEHDLRRFITASGVDIKALEQQVADPMNHVDIQLQAISAQTGIPKRILVGSERGELSSSQDKEQWLGLINTRMLEYAEPEILRPFVDKCMVLGILPKVESYNVVWEDIFAPSEKEKVAVGKERATTLKLYSEAILANDILPPSMVGKLLLGLTAEQVQEMVEEAKEMAKEEDKLLATEEARLKAEEKRN